MTQYIEKDALVAEIRKRLLPVIRDKHYDEWEEGQNSERMTILDIIDTLEVKEEVTTTDGFVKKACDWLTKHAKKYYFNKERYLGTDELVEDFKLSMEI